MDQQQRCKEKKGCLVRVRGVGAVLALGSCSAAAAALPPPRQDQRRTQDDRERAAGEQKQGVLQSLLPPLDRAAASGVRDRAALRPRRDQRARAAGTGRYGGRRASIVVRTSSADVAQPQNVGIADVFNSVREIYGFE
jgi:hypothetical protein